MIENADMLYQLIGAFGMCVCSTVRERFPKGQEFARGATQSQAIGNLKTTSHVNSILELSFVTKENNEVEYSYQKKQRGVDLRYDFEINRFTAAVWYVKLDSTDPILQDFYTNLQYDDESPQERSQETSDISLVGREFEVYESLFVVTNVHNGNVDCRVTESDNTQYSNNSIHTFNIEFVQTKINEYLE